MGIAFKNRKTGYLILFASIIVLQLLLFFVWVEKNNNQEKLEKAFLEKKKTNLALEYFDAAVYHFFDAESNFNTYLQDYQPVYLKEYRSSVLTMSQYLDSLQQLMKKDSRMGRFVAKKQKTEENVLVLKKRLDDLINAEVVPLTADNQSQKKLSQDTNKEMKSLRYDIVKVSNKIKKKKLLARIIDAIRNKQNYNKNELIVYLSQAFEGKVSPGKKDDLAHLFLATDQYYANQYNDLKGAYKNLKNKDKELIWVNRCIIDNCQEILTQYSGTIKAIGDLNYSRYQDENTRQGKTIYVLLALILLLTLALLLYTWYAYDYGKKLVSAKAEIEHNLEFKNRLIGMLSHEMKAPLNIISNLTEKIKEANHDNALDESVNTLLFTSNSLQLTVNQILNFFKNENTQLVLYKSEINLNQEVQSIISSLQSLAETKKLQFLTQIDKNLDVNVLADNGKIHQLFYNIIGNAIKFTDKGAITVSSKTSAQKGKIKLEVTIKDTGIGIPQADLEHIFDEYYQSKSANSKISLGAGLGLNLCKEIIALHEGEIEVKSETGKGTEISFFLLLEKATNKNQSSKTKLLSHAEKRTLKVAFVDDDVMMTTILKKLLNDVHFESFAFHSANEIKTFLKKNKVDIIITDLEISGYSGLELIDEIKLNGKTNAQTPIIVITGNDYMQKLENNTADAVIIKPIDREEFYSKLLKTIEKP